MTDNRKYDEPGIYQIRVSGVLDDRWSDWFDGFSFNKSSVNETVLTGCVTDQAALHGLLNKIRDIGLPLISVERIEDEEGL
ncbi:MAG: hypothetical protein MUO67_15285 [Anaerolineales bacterium]|nr:hypothetical protein [Anaerolineales bacterium]